MQVPASTPATVGTQNTPSNASSTASTGDIFGLSTRSRASKKSLLPAFATILAQQADEKDIGKDSGDATGSGTFNLVEENTPRLADGKFIPFVALGASGAKVVQHTQTENAASAKSDTNITRQPVDGRTSSGTPVKKQNGSASALASISTASPVIVLPGLPVAAEQTVQKLIGMQSFPAPAVTLSKSSSFSYSSGAFDTADRKEEFGMQAAVAAPSGVATSSIPSVKLESQPMHVAPDAIAVGASAEVPASMQESLSQAQRFSAGLSALRKTEDTTSSREAFVVESQVASQAGVSRPKPQQKTGENASSNTTILPANSSASALSRMSGDAPATGPLAHAGDSDDGGTKKDFPLLDATPFQRLDSGEAPATLLHSSAHQIAVGVHDPSLGWLEVQTQSTAGHISATLSTASTDAHANLAAEMPAITQYLADRNVSLHSLSVDTQGSAAGGGQSQQSSSGDAQQGTARHIEIVSSDGGQSLPGGAQDSSVIETVSSSRISVRA